MQEDQKYIQRCFELAKKGQGNVSPNPLVGCVIVAQNKIIGEGWHKQYGKEHAEVNAINAVRPNDIPLLKESTIYVNLEPCSIHGNTPPCCDLIIKKGIPNIVIANIDTDPRVKGSGLDKLRKAGKNVRFGILKKEGRVLNKHFFTYHKKNRPYITLKWAQSEDNFIGNENEPIKISNALTQRFTHKMRAEMDAILVGTRTALIDNPQLTNRFWPQQNQPIRIVIDRSLKVPKSSHLFDNTSETWIINNLKEDKKNNITWLKLDQGNFLKKLLNKLQERKVLSLLVEGGAYTINRFIELDLWDEALIYKSPMLLKKGIVAPKLNSTPQIKKALGNNLLEIYYNQQ